MRRNLFHQLGGVFAHFFLPAVLTAVLAGPHLFAEPATNSIRPPFERPYLIKKLDFHEIGPWYETYVRSALRDASEAKADLIILEIDSPGGRVDSALKIVNLLLDLKAHLVVFVNKNAISAGALISLTGKEIYMNEGSVIGASTPVIAQGQEMKKASEKMVSVMRAEFRSLAQKRGRPVAVCEAMVDEERGLDLKQDGYDLPKGKLLTLSTDEALRLKVADKKAGSLEALYESLGVKESAVKTYELKSGLKLLSLLSHPALLGILMTIGILGLYYELTHPTWGIAGTLGVLALTLFFVIQIFLQNAGWQVPALFAVGVALVLLEIFVIPGFGIVGILGILLVLGSLFLSFGISNWSTALTTVTLSLLAVAVVVVVSFRFLPESRLFKKVSMEAQIHATVADHSHKLPVGTTGIAASDLRPMGKGEFELKIIEVSTRGEFITRGSPIKIIAHERRHAVVVQA